MKNIEHWMRYKLIWAWSHSLAKLADLDNARPSMMEKIDQDLRIVPYIMATIRSAAPKSTIFMLLFTLLATVASIVQSFALGKITEAAETGSSNDVAYGLMCLMSLWLASPLLQVLHSVARLFCSQNLRIVVSENLAARLMHGQVHNVANFASGNYVERIELASTCVPTIVSTTSDTIVKLLIIMIITSLILTEVSLSLAVFTAIWMVTAILLSSYLAYTGLHIVEHASDAHANVMASLTEIIMNIPLIQNFLAQVPERKSFGVKLDKDLEACRKVRSYWIFVLLLESIYKWVFGISVFTFSLSMYMQGVFNTGQLVTVCSLIIAVSWHFETIAFHFVDLFDAVGTLSASLNEISKIKLTTPTTKQSIVFPSPGSMKMSNVCASRNGKLILDDISLNIEMGEKIGIVGPSGSGKSSFLALLSKHLERRSGSIEIHGLMLDGVHPHYLAAESNVAAQSAVMFNRSIWDNLTFGSAGATPKMINDALLAAQIKKFTDQLPEGLQSILGEHGANLSTGERQRLAIARALLRPASLLIFDEATSSVDLVSEELIIKHLASLNPKTTVIIVSHRIATLKSLDRIIVFNSGKIEAVGRHSELMATSSYYRVLQLESNII